MAKAPPDPERGLRFRRMRLALGMDVTRVADKLGVSLSKWQNWEAGGGISPPEAINVASVLGLSLDYIYTDRDTLQRGNFASQVRQVTKAQLEADMAKKKRGRQPKIRVKSEAAD